MSKVTMYRWADGELSTKEEMDELGSAAYLYVDEVTEWVGDDTD